MRPVKQTVIDPQRGNCTEAAIASILHCAIDKVPPAPPGRHKPGTGERTEEGDPWDLWWRNELGPWLAEKGFGLVGIDVEEIPHVSWDRLMPDTYWIAVIPSPAGYHAVVYRGVDPIWDPERGTDIPKGEKIAQAFFFVIDAGVFDDGERG